MSFHRPTWWCRAGRHEMYPPKLATDTDTGEQVLVSVCAWCGLQSIQPAPAGVRLEDAPK